MAATSAKPARTWNRCGASAMAVLSFKPGSVQKKPKATAVTASHSHIRMRASAKAAAGHHRDVDVERPVVRLAGRDQQRRDECADEAQARERRAVQQRRGERRERDDAEQHEGHAGLRKP